MGYLRIISFMGRGHMCGLMEGHIRGHGIMGKWMDMGSFIGQMELHMRDSIKMMRGMEKGLWYGHHLRDIEVNGHLVTNMDMDNQYR